MVEKIVSISGKVAAGITPLESFVVTTKLIPPISRHSILDRPELLQKLGLQTPAPLTVFCAPAGYGKTTLAVSWLKKLTVKSAWYSLDDDDNESSRFLLYFIAAVQTQFHNFSSNVVPNLITPQATNIHHSLSLIINNIARLDEDLVVVLDDYHRIHNTEIHQIVNTLVKLSPSNFFLCIVTRTKPNLPMSQLRVRNRLLEITKDDLRFSSRDAQWFFRNAMQLNELNDTQFDSLISKTEGWIAGMQLAAIGIRERPNANDLIEVFSDRNYLVEDYFVDEILANADDATRKFLLFTSILSRFNASLCRTLMPDIDAGAMFDKLERLGYFILPLDYTREWYRYHHLFAAMLQSKLEEKYPEKISDLHQKASLWYESHGDYDDAFRHACMVNTFVHAARIFEKCFWINVIKGRFSDSYRWLTMIPISQFESDASLAALHAWCLFTAKGIFEEQWLMRSEQLLKNCDDIDTKNDILLNINLLRGFSACRVKDFRKSIEYVERYMHSSAVENVARRNIALTILGSNYHALGKLDVAESHYSEAISHAITHRIVSSFFPAIVGLSQLKLERGESQSAQKVIEIGFDVAKRFHWESLSNMAWLYLGQGEIEFHQGNFERSHEMFNQAHTQGQHLMRNMVRHFAALRIAAIHALKGQSRVALSYINEASSEPYNAPLTPIISDFNIVLSSVYNSIGLLDKADETLAEFNRDGLDEREISHRQAWVVKVHHHLCRRQWEAASATLVPAIGEFESRGMKVLLVQSFILLAIAKYGMGNTNSAYVQMISALSIASSSNIAAPFFEYRNLIQWFSDGVTESRLERENIARDFIQRVFSKQIDDTDTPDSIKTHAVSLGSLSSKEREALKWLASGMSNTEISEKMYVSVNTIKTHLKNIFAKLGVRTRAAAITKAIDAGIVESKNDA